MIINANKPDRWKSDIAQSVDQFNRWFIRFAPQAYREARAHSTEQVREAFRITDNLRALSPEILRENPSILPVLRMSTCPPLARDRLSGLAAANRGLILRLEKGALPKNCDGEDFDRHLQSICRTIDEMLDVEVFPWLSGGQNPTRHERNRSATIVADRLCGAVSDPIIRNAQEKRQLACIRRYLMTKGYIFSAHLPGTTVQNMHAGTFSFRTNVSVGDEKRRVNIPVDCAVQPQKLRANGMPILIEAKSAGDYTNTNKRRKEEATKYRQLRDTYGNDVLYLLFLCGYFDGGYLGYEAAEGIDWVWEHRIEDFDQLDL